MTDEIDTTSEAVERHRHYVQDAYHRADAMEHGDTYGDTPAALRRLADHADTLRARVTDLEEEVSTLRLVARQYEAADATWAETEAQLERERDEALARAAAAYEDAAEIAARQVGDWDYMVEAARAWHAENVAAAIRALATDPERDALAERDKRIRREERERCAKTALSAEPPDVDWDKVWGPYEHGVDDTQKAIYAAIRSIKDETCHD